MTPCVHPAYSLLLADFKPGFPMSLETKSLIKRNIFK